MSVLSKQYPEIKPVVEAMELPERKRIETMERFRTQEVYDSLQSAMDTSQIRGIREEGTSIKDILLAHGYRRVFYRSYDAKEKLFPGVRRRPIPRRR